jgi:hypothetical protein
MDIDDHFELEHLFLTERKCRVCKEIKDLMDGFYLTRKDRGYMPSAYSYECKVCTVRRISDGRKKLHSSYMWEYPDW